MFNGSPQALLTLGLGTGAGFDGSVPWLLTLGLGAGEEVVDVSGNYGWIEYTADGGRLHYSTAGRIHYSASPQDEGR